MSTKLIDAKVKEVVTKLEKAGLPPIDFSISVKLLRPGVAGTACYSQSHINISKEYLKEFPEEIISTTIPHEITHLYVKKYYPNSKQSHGPTFRKIMNVLGLKGETRHSLKLSKSQALGKMKTRYIYITEHSKEELELTSGQHKSCQYHLPLASRYKGEKITFTNKIRKFK
jgi:predicted SprT family Zn-dependent metalloprotease